MPTSLASTLPLLCASMVADPPVVLDGRFEEWAGRPAALIDPADAGRAGLDLGVVKVADDPSSVAFFVELGRTVNLQRLPGRLVLVVDEDGDPSTGDVQHGLDGADLIVVFTPPDPKAPTRPGVGVAARRFVDGAWRERGPYVQAVAFAPTAAARNAEIRLERDATTFDRDRFRFRFVAYDAAGSVQDETAVVASALSTRPAAQQAPDSAVDPLIRAADTRIRVVSWNVERGGLTIRSDVFARVLRALDADVLLLSELTDAQSADAIREWLDRHLGAPGAASTWNVVFGSGGGNLRTAVASRRGLSAVASLDRVTWTEGAGEARDVRFAAGIVNVDGLRLLACAVHLKCCGAIGTEEDLTRLEETQSIRAALRTASMSGGVESSRRGADALVIGGDLNLVGAFEPLDLLVEGLDVDGTNLGIAEALQLDNRSSSTWADPGQPFTPGRLDYLVFADSVLIQCGGFVLDTRDLSRRWLEAHGLRAQDTADASDHLPVVVDLAIRSAGSAGR